MKLIPEWKRAHRLWSVRLGAVTATLAGLDWLLPTLQDSVPRWLYLALSLAVVIARVVQQGEQHGNQ